MTKRILALMIALLIALSALAAVAETVAINSKTFPDKSFRKIVKKLCDANGDGKLSEKELRAVKALDLDGNNLCDKHPDLTGIISDLKGIEYFTNLRTLDFSVQDVQTLDVSKNTRLRSLYGTWNENLKSVKLGNQKYLDHLILSYCFKLKKLDIGGCPKLLALLDQYNGIDGCFGQIEGGPGLELIESGKLYNGKKLAARTRKPTAIAFKKTSVTLTRKQIRDYSPYDLGICLILEPAGTMYPIRYTSSNRALIKVLKGYGDGSDSFYFAESPKKGASCTLTATCGDKTAKIRIKVK